MTVAIVAEKPSAARNFAKALGGTSGTYKGTKFIIVNLRGHLYEFKSPDKMLKDSSKSELVRKWTLAQLPWDPGMFTWKRAVRKDGAALVKDLRAKLSNSDITEIVNGADLDPTGEGDLLFWEVMDALNLHHKKFTRMEFVDESDKSLQKAFENRRPIVSMESEGAYRKAEARSRMDLLTMQHTRIASLVGGQQSVLRQGRLKSAMVKLVVDQWEAWKSYKKVPYFQNRFRDENGVIYINPAEPQFDKKSLVPNIYTDSAVELVSKADKYTGPPKLLDLAGLSARLASAGIKASTVLSVYQKLYEDKIVSYPRTDDKTITFEQFNELLPLAGKIASVVGVDAGLLVHKSPRKTHVKDVGAHGANRPGPNVPASMAALSAKYGDVAVKIYDILARNYLAMLCADYKYEQQKGRVSQQPLFVGTANVPLDLGWRAIFDGDEDFESSKGLGTLAKPFVYEGANPRPQHPTMRWLMAQLEKRNVGTGATRTSIYADTTSTKHKYPLLKEARGKITPTEYGIQSHRLLIDTNIGDLGATESFYKMMDEIEKGQATVDDGLSMVTAWVVEDMETMKRNSASMKKELGLSDSKEKFSGFWNGQSVQFSRTWGGHRFSDEEAQALIEGKEIEFTATGKAGNEFTAKGVLAKQSFTTEAGKVVEFVGFKLDDSVFGKKNNGEYVTGIWEGPEGQKEVSFKKVWGGHTFTDVEIANLLAGNEISFTATARSGNPYTCFGSLGYGSFAGAGGKTVKFFGFQPDFERLPDSFAGYTFSADEKAKLKAGEKIFVTGFVSKKGNTFNATASYGTRDDGKKGIILDFG